MNKSAEPSEFLVISRGQWDKERSPAEIQVAIDEFYTWLGQMIAEGKMKPGQRLMGKGKTVSRQGILMDGPYGEAKEVVGGYWFIRAHSLDEAVAYAGQNPCLRCGLFYEIRPIDPQIANAFNEMTETPR